MQWLNFFIIIKHLYLYNILINVSRETFFINKLNIEGLLKYNYHVFICTNKRAEGHPRGCCAQKNSVKLRNFMKIKVKSLGLEKIRINAAGCLDKCELGPTVVIYPEGIWYAIKNEEDVEAIINEHIIKGKTVKHLLMVKKA